MSAYTAMRRKDTTAAAVAQWVSEETVFFAPGSEWTEIQAHGNVAYVYFRKGKYDYRIAVERLDARSDDPIGHAWGES